MACSLSSLIAFEMFSASRLRIARISPPLGNSAITRSMSLSFSSNLIERKRVEYLCRIASLRAISFLMASILFSNTGP